METLSLRPYQSEAIEQVRDLIRHGKRHILVCSPTGSGKSLIGAQIIADAVNKGSRTTFVVDRTTLIHQTSELFDRYGIDHGVMQASHWRFRPHQQVQVCSAQTIARRQWPESVLDIVDECHVVNKVVRDRIAQNQSIVVGLTATPFTPGLGKLYDGFVNVTTTDKLIDDGFLTPFRIYAATEPDMKGVKVVAGEYEEREASKRALEVVGDVVAEYMKHGDGKKFIAFAVDVAHAEELKRQFMAAGVMAETFTYKVGDEEREQITAEFRKPDSFIRGLISVESLTRGFDVPDVEVLILARPLRKALAVHLQMMGRVLRLAPGKTVALVLDHAGNCTRFFDDMMDFYANGVAELDDGKKREKAAKPQDEADNFMKCPQCRALHKRMPYCPVCGHEYPKKPSVAHVAGTLQELIASGDRKTLTHDVWPQVCGYAKAHRENAPDRAEKLALALYKRMTGQWPAAKFAATTPVPPTPAVAGKIRSLNIAWAKTRAKEERAAA